MAKQFRYLTLVFATMMSVGTADGVSAETDRVRKLEFTVFSPASMPATVYQITEKPAPRFTAVKFFPSSRSPMYEYRDNGAVCFFDARTHAILAAADVPPNVSKALLIFVNRPKGSGGEVPFQAYVFDDSLGNLPPGGLGILNLSGLHLSGSVGSELVDLADGYRGPFHPSAETNVSLNVQVRDRVLRSYSNLIDLGNGQRGMLILLPPYRRGSIEVQYRLLIDNGVAGTASPLSQNGARGRD